MSALKTPAENASKETEVEYAMRYWNGEYHILIDNHHVFCGPEYICRAYLEGGDGLTQMVKRT